MLSSARTPPCLLTLILVSALSVVSLTMFLPSLASIATAFGADYGLVNLSIAGYAAMTAVLQLVMGPLSDRFGRRPVRSEEHTSELQSLMRISYAVFCLKKKINNTKYHKYDTNSKYNSKTTSTNTLT